MNGHDEEQITLIIKIKDRHSTWHEGEIERAEFETDEAFFVRAQKMLDKLREGVS